MSGKTCFDCHKDIAENSKFCSHCGIAQSTETPKPVVEMPVKTVEQEFDEFLNDFKKKILLSYKLTKSNLEASLIQIMEKYDLKELPEKFKQFGPLFINPIIADDTVVMCKLEDIIPIKYHTILVPQAIFDAYKKDKLVYGNYICHMSSLRYVNGSFRSDLKKNFINTIDILKNDGGFSEEYIIKHLETIKADFMTTIL